MIRHYSRAGRSAPSSRLVICGCALLLAFGPAACKARPPAEKPAPAAEPPPAPADSGPTAGVLLSLPVSAYHASITAGDDDVADLLTPSSAYRLSPGHPPAERNLDLGGVAAATPSSYLFWSRGAVRAVPKSGGSPQVVSALPEQPQSLVASEAGVAWLVRSPGGTLSLQAPRGKTTATLYTSPGRIDALSIGGDRLFFVERPSGTEWRIGALPLAGGAPSFTAPRAGRAPAMLAVNQDLAFYVGAGFEVHRLSRDLQRERTVASGFVCSPLALRTSVYCSHPEGIFVLAPDEPPRRLLPGNLARPVTDIAAGPRTLYWIVDDGTDHLQVRSLPLP